MVFIKDCLMSLGTGIVVGGVFSLMKLSVPAPNFLGFVGIGGLILGYVLVNYFK